MKNDAMQRRAGGVKLSSIIFCVTVLVAGLPARGRAQVNSGSNGSDGSFNPTTSPIVINMADHPTGIYQYTSVNIPSGVTVSFIPNANNTPVVWLVQSNVVINGRVDVSGKYGSSSYYTGNSTQGGQGGPGGWSGGNGGITGGVGQGPGGGSVGLNTGLSGSYGTLGVNVATNSGLVYGNQFLIPLLGGSGGGGATYGPGAGGGGGGGAILIVASGQINMSGFVQAYGGQGASFNPSTFLVTSGDGSGGAVRLVTTKLIGSGTIIAVSEGWGGEGRVRLDTYENDFGGQIAGAFTQGSQFIIIPSAGQLPQLTVTSVGGVPVSASPSGVLSTPDAVISAQQSSPMPVVVNCANLPLGTAITVTIKPMTGSSVSAVGSNNTGILASSTATISINVPRGGGLIYATAATGN